MTWDRNKLQKLTDFDFSQEGAHIAIVGKGANGKEKFLVKKSLGEALQKEVTPDMTYEQLEEQAMQVSTTMPLADLLELQGLWRWDALVIASAINKSKSPVDSKEKLEKFIVEGLDLEDLKGETITVDKKEERSMPAESGNKVTEDKASEEVSLVSEDLEKSVEAETLKKELEELKKSLSKDKEIREGLEKEVELLKSQEDQRILKAYEEKAEGFTALGLGKEDALVLKSVETIEGGAKILEALNKANDILKADNDPITLEEGHGSEGATLTAIEELKAIAKGFQEENKDLSEVEALSKACKTNPNLYIKYVEEGVK